MAAEPSVANLTWDSSHEPLETRESSLCLVSGEPSSWLPLIIVIFQGAHTKTQMPSCSLWLSRVSCVSPHIGIQSLLGLGWQGPFFFSSVRRLWKMWDTISLWSAFILQGWIYLNSLPAYNGFLFTLATMQCTPCPIILCIMITNKIFQIENWPCCVHIVMIERSGLLHWWSYLTHLPIKTGDWQFLMFAVLPLPLSYSFQ